MNKADYVRAAISEGKTGRHHCHWPGCNEAVAQTEKQMGVFLFGNKP